MARNLPAAVATAIVGKVVNLAFFAEFQFASGTIRMWSGYGVKAWNGHNWTGGGDLVGMTPADETTEVGATGIAFTLSGIPSSLLALALGDNYRGRVSKAWMAILDANAAVIDAYQFFGGRMDVMKIEDGDETGSIVVQAESRQVDLKRPRTSRYTDAEQQRLFPGDLGCEFPAKLAEKPLYWGVPPGPSAGRYGEEQTVDTIS